MLNCHCRDCQRAGGSGYAPVLAAPAAAVKVKGSPRYYKTVGDGGKAVERGFCANCGSQVLVKLERLPDLIGIQAASLDDPSLFKPTLDIFTESAWAWDHLSPSTEKRPHGMF
jgi:hypothetical protein